MSKIAIIQTAFPGDVIISTPIFESLKSAGHYVVAVIRPQAEPLVRYNEYVDTIITYDKNAGLGAFLKTASELRKQNCDTALIVQKHLRSALLAVYAGIGRRIGYEIAYGRSLYTDTVPFDRSVHAVNRAMALCQGLSPIGGFRPKIFIDEKSGETAVRFLESNRLNPDDFIVFAPGSIWATKRWPYYADLVKLIWAQTGCDIALLGSAEDKRLCETIVISSKQAAINLAGQTDLLLSAAIIEKARLVIANDSAPTHIAAALGTPVVAIFGPTVTRFGFAPYSRNSAVIENTGLYCRPCSPHGPNRCPEKHFRCMLEISPETVLAASLKLVKKR
jgi:heptosyltransferase-2